MLRSASCSAPSTCVYCASSATPSGVLVSTWPIARSRSIGSCTRCSSARTQATAPLLGAAFLDSCGVVRPAVKTSFTSLRSAANALSSVRCFFSRSAAMTSRSMTPSKLSSSLKVRPTEELSSSAVPMSAARRRSNSRTEPRNAA